MSLVAKERRKRRGKTQASSESSSSKISAHSISLIIDKLKNKQHRDSTTKNYLTIWRKFNKFVIRLDVKPRMWEDWTSLFIAYMVEQGLQSASVKSYVSAIKSILVTDGYPWNDNRVLLMTLTKACRMVNDKVYTRLPIQCHLLELILFELQRIFDKQFYLEIMYKALFCLGYYGLMRVGELTFSQHCVKAKDIHMGMNKDKILIVLHLSKTHGVESRPQKIKISSVQDGNSFNRFRVDRHFCPFSIVNEYLLLRGNYAQDGDELFVFRDRSVVLPTQARKTLKLALTNLNLDSECYDMHSLRIGRASDMIRYGYSIDQVKIAGRWKSSCVYHYIRQ